MNSTYKVALQHLRNVLSEAQFHPQAAQRPWWQTALRWLLNKLHLHVRISQTDWKVVGWWIGIASGLLVVLTVLWAVFSALQARKTKGSSTAGRQEGTHNSMIFAKRSLTDGDFTQMLHYLMEACLRFAEAKGWIRYVPFKTARQYLTQVSDIAEAPFVIIYTRIVETSEAVLFAGRRLSPDEALDVYTRVMSLWTEDAN